MHWNMSIIINPTLAYARFILAYAIIECMRLNTWINSLYGYDDNQLYSLSMRLVLDYMNREDQNSYFYPANYHKGLYWLAKRYRIAYRDLVKQLDALEKYQFISIKTIGKMKYVELLSKD